MVGKLKITKVCQEDAGAFKSLNQELLQGNNHRRNCKYKVTGYISAKVGNINGLIMTFVACRHTYITVCYNQRT